MIDCCYPKTPKEYITIRKEDKPENITLVFTPENITLGFHIVNSDLTVIDFLSIYLANWYTMMTNNANKLQQSLFVPLCSHRDL